MKKTFCILALFLLTLEVTASTQKRFIFSDSSKIIFEAYGKKGIKNIEGDILLPAKYESLMWESNPGKVVLPVIPFKKNGYWGIINNDYEELTEAKFVSLIPFNSTTLIAAIKGKYSQTIFYGLVDLNGKIKLAFNYRNLIPAGEILIAAAKKENSIRIGLIDSKGKEVVPFNFYRINYLGQGYFAIEDLQGMTSIRSINDFEGTVLSAIDSVSVFENDLAIIYKGGQAGMLHKSGQLVLPITYKSIQRNDGKLVEVESYREWDILSEEGDLLYRVQADSVEYIKKGLLVLRKNGKSFLKNLDSVDTQVLSLEGSYLQSWNKYYLVKTGVRTVLRDTANLKVVMQLGDFIDANDHFLICKTREFSGIAYTILSSEGQQIKASAFELGKEVIFVKIGRFWGVYNHELEELIQPIYDFVGLGRKQGEFIVKFRGDYGVIGEDQKWIISPEMIKLEVIAEGQYWAVNKTLREYIFLHERKKEADLHFLIKEGKIYETNNEGYIRLLDQIGEPLMSYVKGDFYAQNERGFLIKEEAKFSFFNFSGERTFKVEGYSSIDLIEDEFMPIKKDGAFGFIDQKGKLRIANRYNGVEAFSEGLAAVNINGHWGYVNMDEDLVIQPYYDQVRSFTGGLAQVELNKKRGMIDKEGRVVVPIEYDSIMKVSELILLLKDKKWGYADQTGKIITYPQYDAISVINDLLLVEKYKKLQLINSSGKILLNSKYDGFYWDESNLLYGGFITGSKYTTFLSDLKNGIYP